MIEVKIDKKDVEAAINVLNSTKTGAQKAVNRAINRALMRGSNRCLEVFARPLHDQSLRR